MYHLNILKPWREVFPVVLVMVVPQRDNLGLEVCLKIQLNPPGTLWRPSLAIPMRDCPVGNGIFKCVFTWSQHPHITPYRVSPRYGFVQPSLSITQKNKQVVWQEHRDMLDMGVIDVSHRNRCITVVLHSKQGTVGLTGNMKNGVVGQDVWYLCFHLATTSTLLPRDMMATIAKVWDPRTKK